MLSKHVLLIWLGIYNLGAFAGVCLSSLRDPDSDDTTPDTGKWAECPKPAAGWACSDPSLTFPTIDCIVADMKACGIIGTGPTVFYSFGAHTDDVRIGFRDKLTPRGVMFNDVLSLQWYSDIVAGRPEFLVTGSGPRLDYLRNMLAVAMATASAGEVFIVAASRISAAPIPGLPGAYQNPTQSPNIWRDYEFPTIQRNEAVTKVTSVAIDNNFQGTTDWTRGEPVTDTTPLLPLPVFNGPPDNPATPDNPARRQLVQIDPVDDKGSCALLAAATTSVAAASTITAAPTLSCELQSEDPDQGINQAYCLCDKSITLTPLSVASTGQQSDSCAYTTMPGTSASEVVTTQAATYTNNCQACTLIGGIADTPSCTSVSGCIPTQALAQVQAGSSPVHVGTLTGTALYTSISSALETLCPPVTQTTTSTICAETGQVIGGISYVLENELATDGELTVRAEASSYNETSLRDAMIHSAALTAQQASTAASNCYNQSYSAEDYNKRDIVPSRFNLLGRDHPYPEQKEIGFCNSVSFAAVQYYNQYWRLAPEPGPTNYIYANWEFTVGPGGLFSCEFLGDLIEELSAITPEFAVEEVSLGEDIQASCEDAIEIGIIKGGTN